MGKMKEEYQDNIEDSQSYRDMILEEEQRLEQSQEEFMLVYSEFSEEGYTHIPSLVQGKHILCNSYFGDNSEGKAFKFYRIYRYELDEDGITRHYVRTYLRGERLKAEKGLYQYALDEN
jgi:hypothetical protein